MIPVEREGGMQPLFIPANHVVSEAEQVGQRYNLVQTQVPSVPRSCYNLDPYYNLDPFYNLYQHHIRCLIDLARVSGPAFAIGIDHS